MRIRDILGPDAVELEDMLAEREARAEAQRRLLSDGGDGLVSLSHNMAGPVKDFPLLRCAFQEGRRLTEKALDRCGAGWRLAEERLGICGPCAFYRVEGPLPAIKSALCAVEDDSSLGRLLDLDVLDLDGNKLSRQDGGHPPRQCLLCEEQAAVCGRSRRHSVADLQRETVRRLMSHFSALCADHVSACAARAMLYEVSVTPKPGLVDRGNSGAHRDMDFFTFVDSAAALTPWFRRFCLLGFQEADALDEDLFRAAQRLGQEADDAMFAATNGVNTHKGLIFSLGLLCTAAGQLYWRNLLESQIAFPDTDALLSRTAALAVCSLPDLERQAAATNGARVFQTYRVKGVRQEAAEGFPSVARWVLPVLEHSGSPEENGKRALLTLFTQVEDTNVLHRGGPAALEHLSRRAAQVLAAPEADFDRHLADFDRELIKAGISPGGCADLLAVGYFLRFL